MSPVGTSAEPHLGLPKNVAFTSQGDLKKGQVSCLCVHYEEKEEVSVNGAPQNSKVLTINTEGKPRLQVPL